MTFLLAAISKVLASTVTYPFSLAKTRAQVSSQEPSSGTGETSDKEKSNDALGSRALQARQRTVFSTILRIAQTEGIWGLYQGLGAEVLKGFFSHGITMLMKDRIHAVIISLYYTVQNALKKYPSPSEVAKSASDSVQNAYEQGKEQASEAYAKGAEVVGSATESAKQVVSHGSHEAQELVEKGRQHAADAYSKGAQAAETATASAQDAVHSGTQQAGQVYEKSREAVGNAASSVYDQGKSVLDKGQNAASNATQQTGDAFEQGKQAASDASQQAKDAVLDADIKDINGPDKGIKE
jgi:vacuolar-type H+-ATPase subunit H